MGFLHSMTCQTEGITAIRPAQWQSYDALCAVYWHAQADKGAHGYYRSPDPRIMLFFEDVSQRISIADAPEDVARNGRPMLQALYVPPDQEMWTRFSGSHSFSHLDLHINRAWLLDQLAPVLGHAQAQRAISVPVERENAAPLVVIGHTLARELANPESHPLFAQSLAMSLVSGLLDLSGTTSAGFVSGGLTPLQMRRLREMVARSQGARLSTADLARAVGLSESWFIRAFKHTTGKTPLQWQQECRLALVKTALTREGLSISDAAARFGFADQAHLTRVFRRHESTTPAAWLREQSL